MRHLSVAAAMLMSLSVSVQASCEDLYFSQYLEGSSYNKALELFNPSNVEIDLSHYSIELYSNGKSVSTGSLELTGLMAAKGVFVISNAKANSSILDKADLLNNNVVNFNGDDALVLKKDGVIIDSIGQIGFDPGSSWSNNGVSTKDMTLERKLEQSCENNSALDAFDPSLEWDGFTKDSVANLGSYEQVENPEIPAETIFTHIHDIQGAGTKSELVDEKRSIEAVVVGSYLNKGLKGFFLQEEDKDIDDNENTSEGIFVYCPSCTEEIKMGDLVYVEGKVSEYNGMTQLSASLVEVRANALSIPSATAIQLPVENLKDYEKMEGMLVSLSAENNPLVVNDNYNLGRYGSFTLGSERTLQYTQTHKANSLEYALHQEESAKKNIVIDDGSSFQNPDFIPFPQGGLSAENTLRVGYTINNFSGVLDERYGSYRVQVNSMSDTNFNKATNERGLPRKQIQSKRKGFFSSFFKHKRSSQVRVASYNVLNYFNTFEGCSYGVSGAEADCRGADNIEEFQRQREKIIQAIIEIDADVYGLMEIENDGYDASSAIADLVNGLNEKLGDETYSFVNVDEKMEKTDALGTDAIKVALIYNKKRVSPSGKPHALVLDENNKNRPSLLQLFKKKHSWRKLLVSVNHFKSKGSSCQSLSYEEGFDLDLHDGQANCNLTRTYAADKLVKYIDGLKGYKKSKNILLLGDFNSYAKEDPIMLMQDNGYQNILAEKEGLEASSYNYKAEAGTLDYALASKSLFKKVKQVQVWNSNADEPRALDYNTKYKSDEQVDSFYKPDAYRASDHDPIIVDIKL